MAEGVLAVEDACSDVGDVERFDIVGGQKATLGVGQLVLSDAKGEACGRDAVEGDVRHGA
ncbi:hypothetical protein [Propioniciclava flava]